jgi:hypothetical protein
MTSLYALVWTLLLSIACAWKVKSGALSHNFGRALASVSIGLATMSPITPALARPEGVNRPELLPKGPVVPLIDTGNFLAKGQEKRIIEKLNALEQATGYKLRILCQAYPETPGLAIKDYWKIDDNTVVLVADKGEGFNRQGIPTNLINLNIGKNLDLVLSNQFWNRLTNKLGNQPYVKAFGADTAVLNSVEAITFCLQDGNCKDLPFKVEEP